jgi:hypothetical protein
MPTSNTPYSPPHRDAALRAHRRDRFASAGILDVRELKAEDGEVLDAAAGAEGARRDGVLSGRGRR